jgi:hypothetical protein
MIIVSLFYYHIAVERVEQARCELPQNQQGEFHTLGSDNTVIGFGAGLSLKGGSRNLILGSNADLPTPDTDDYVNLWNVVKVQSPMISVAGRLAVKGYIAVFGVPDLGDCIGAALDRSDSNKNLNVNRLYSNENSNDIVIQLLSGEFLTHSPLTLDRPPPELNEEICIGEIFCNPMKICQSTASPRMYKCSWSLVPDHKPAIKQESKP